MTERSVPAAFYASPVFIRPGVLSRAGLAIILWSPCFLSLFRINFCATWEGFIATYIVKLPDPRIGTCKTFSWVTSIAVGSKIVFWIARSAFIVLKSKTRVAFITIVSSLTASFAILNWAISYSPSSNWNQFVWSWNKIIKATLSTDNRSSLSAFHTIMDIRGARNTLWSLSSIRSHSVRTSRKGTRRTYRPRINCVVCSAIKNTYSFRSD